jgi:hypothetical protein
LFANDLKRHPAAAKVLTAARARYERDGVPRTERYDCDPDHPSGTRLPGCVKVYLPKPGGHWRMVFQIELLLNGVPGLVYLAAGLGHTPREGRRLDVYKLAHHRLHGEWPPRKR